MAGSTDEAQVGQVFFGSFPSAGQSTRAAGARRAAQAAPQQAASSVTARSIAGLASGSQGSISQLQEFIQGSKDFPVMPRRPILEWDYESRSGPEGLRQFMATVSFLLEGLPHHAAGRWQTSKKLAQRDAADRALDLYVRRWGERLLVEEAAGTLAADDDSAQLGEDDEVQLVEDYCTTLAAPPGGSDGGGSGPSAPAPAWGMSQEPGGGFRASLEVVLLGVPHCFCGARSESPEAARLDAARRILWYLQHPEYQEAFESPAGVSAADDLDSTASVGAFSRDPMHCIPPPPVHWAKESSRDSGARRLTVPDTESRLRSSLAQRSSSPSGGESAEPPRESVWEWRIQCKTPAPVRYRATARVPALEREFAGPWRHSERKAQRATCAVVSDFLDTLMVGEAPLPSKKMPVTEHEACDPMQGG